ncbi:potassium/sodium hyperpolarization-activated cyclic nucleotide-gated channel 1-like [Patiria miniata]|uniref:Cyclic nucleotide-binding domain-containing protein n=1 Tax=Patiria miniata TaxID=46514 RepID=A0A914BC79_PATMI|nr:potassium/sodium hyperpolarization-activated cyclic nucleotide-gated channel 1-like [Patiria miniata]
MNVGDHKPLPPLRSNKVMQTPPTGDNTNGSVRSPDEHSTQHQLPTVEEQISSTSSDPSKVSSSGLKSSIRHDGPKSGDGGENGPGHVVFDIENMDEGSSEERSRENSKESIKASLSLLGIPQPRKESDGLSGMKNTFIRRRLWQMLQPTDNRLSMKLFGSKKGLQIEKKRLKAAGFLIVHPCSAFKFYWDLIMVLLLIANLVTLPVIIAFFYQEKLSQSWSTFNCASDSLFILDVIINLRTGYMDLNTAEQVILEPKKIAIHYLKSWFTVDFVSSIPMDCIFLAIDGGNDNKLYEVSKAFRIFRLAKLLSLVRLLRLSRLMRFVRQWEQVFNVAGAVIRIVNLIGIMILVSHWNGCLQFLVPMLQEFPQDSWVSINDLEHAGWWEQYTWALFKAMSHMLCIGYGRFPPQSMTDLWLTMFSMIIGASCFALFIGHATNLIQSMDSSSRQYREKLKQVEEYMAYRKLPSDMRERITDYYDYRYHGKMFNEEVIFSEISVKLKEDVANYNCRDLVACVPFFQNADPNFVTRVVVLLMFEVFQPGDYIIREGTFGDRMFFIQQGVVDVITSDGEIATTLSDGSYFGEICLLTEERRVASVRTDGYCALFSLGVENFHKVLREFPSMRKTMQEVALRRLNKIGKTSKVLVAALRHHNIASQSSAMSSNLLFPLPESSSSAFGESKGQSEDDLEEESSERILQVNEGPSHTPSHPPTTCPYSAVDKFPLPV